HADWRAPLREIVSGFELRIDCQLAALIHEADPPTYRNQRQAVREHSRSVELRADHHLPRTVDIPPLVADSHGCAIVEEAAGLVELRVDDELAVLVDKAIASAQPSQR